MNELRIAILKGLPDPKVLRKFNQFGFRVFRAGRGDLYYLGYPDKVNPETPGFGADHDNILRPLKTYDLSLVSRFFATNEKQLASAFFHEDIIADALSLSEIFQTRALSAYSNDEDCDFVAVAENGKLLRLRIKANHEKTGEVPAAKAARIKTEIQAERVLPEPGSDDEDGVYEFTAYEAIQTETDGLALQPYWRYQEGEIGGRVVFKTVWSQPDNIAPNLMFRNVAIEFAKAFNAPAPDFTYLSKYLELVDFVHPKTSLRPNFKKLFHLLKGYKKLWLGFGAVAVIWTAGMFVDNSSSESERKDFSFYCAYVQGEFTEGRAASDSAAREFPRCTVDGVSYKEQSLPGTKGELRRMGLEVAPNVIACSGFVAEQCLMVNGSPFYNEITGYVHKPGVGSLVMVERLQYCDQAILNDCPQNASPFRFRLIKQIELSRK